ncbi:MAG: thioredoxin [Bacteroidetes bacterium RIFCSPLOWO2_02_FULL_36_8]|nr:MAG: thioredoxin [Bacteroidetes bacterium RIFCSPLOWO2_02_FULL_36_8]OFY69855.1 MAG: thioredoxin [Bacteroidetes bacterium RIFCSPLOWO2_12_FULL_37_12]
MKTDKKPNHLLRQTSPYLLQHLYNPVDWYPWGVEALEKAKKEDKPILVSIGYSACHWCHVMEKECFENDSIADFMNENFISIKVDREERPDIDQIYMDALHTMQRQGGWPLNCFLTPDTKPFYGGTYFPPDRWLQVLHNINENYRNKKKEIEKLAEDVTQHSNQPYLPDFEPKSENKQITLMELNDAFSTMESGFDKRLGGFQRAPKFPMPAIYKFLFGYYQLSGDKKALEQTLLTLNKMSEGGIYDQLGGGFARYSTDVYWLVPHFEKMLYDNAQLISLYCHGYQITKNERFKRVIKETLDYIFREMTSQEGGFFSSQDADSEGKEGFYYLWKMDELKSLLGADLDLFSDYFDVKPSGNWEFSANILNRATEDETFCKKHNLTQEELFRKLTAWNEKLLPVRMKRIHPNLDDKILASWNGLMLKTLTDAYKTTGDENYRKTAIKNAQFLKEKMSDKNFLFHSYKEGKTNVSGMLEDYAFVINAFIGLYEITFDEIWLEDAKNYLDYALLNFWDEKENLFFFTSGDTKLIARKKELFDNVIPASNSQMAINLYKLGLFFDKADYIEKSKSMFSLIKPFLSKNLSHTANWATLACMFSTPTAEIAICGKEADKLRKEMQATFFPNALFMGGTQEGKLPLLENKYSQDVTRIFICFNKTCKMPVETVKSAMDFLKGTSKNSAKYLPLEGDKEGGK